MTHPKAIVAMKNLGLSRDEYLEFLAELKNSVEAQITETKKYIAANDQNKTVDILHSIKGSIGTLGLIDSYNSCQKLESNFKIALSENSMVLLDDFVKIYSIEIAEIQQDL